jgi:hypothetical protein
MRLSSYESLQRLIGTHEQSRLAGASSGAVEPNLQKSGAVHNAVAHLQRPLRPSDRRTRDCCRDNVGQLLCRLNLLFGRIIWYAERLEESRGSCAMDAQWASDSADADGCQAVER